MPDDAPAPSPSILHLKALQSETENFYRTFPPLRNMVSAVEALGLSETHRLFDLAEQYLTREAILDVLAFEQDLYLQHPWYTSPVTALNTGAISGWTLINHPKFLVMLVVFDAVEFTAQKKAGGIRPVVNFPAGDLSLRLLMTAGFTCSHWQAPLIRDDTAVSGQLRCQFAGKATYKTGDTIFCRGGEESITYESMAGTTVGLQIYSRMNRTGVAADYDPESLRLVSLSAADQHSSRLQILNTVIRLFDRQDALPQMAVLLDHPDHFVRWQTAREMTALAPEMALPHLRKLAEEDHNPQVRSCARQTLDRFFSGAGDALAS